MNWRSLLSPLAVLYGGVISLRHLLFDEHLLRSYTPVIPTICVGNIAVGGTGKTPMVEYLIRLLHGQYKVAVLSRGYKRKTHGFILADESATARTIGDEPMQIHSKFPNVIVAVCEDRVHGIKRLERMADRPDVVLLDDAYQHRAVRCGLTIVLTAFDKLYVHDHLMPWGSLRDVPFRVSKANIVVVTKCPDSMQPIQKRVVDNTLRLATFQHLFFSRIQYEPTELPGIPLIVTCVAHPEHLIDHVRSIYPEAEALSYADHHAFTAADVETIISKAERHFCVVTTEKDFQRMLLTGLPERLGKPIIPLPIHLTVDNEDTGSMDEVVLTYVRESIAAQEASGKGDKKDHRPFRKQLKA